MYVCMHVCLYVCCMFFITVLEGSSYFSCPPMDLSRFFFLLGFIVTFLVYTHVIHKKKWKLFFCPLRPTHTPTGHGIQPQAPLAVPGAQQLQGGVSAAAVAAATAAVSSSPAAVAVPGGAVPAGVAIATGGAAGAVPTSPAQTLAANLSSQVR